MSIDTIRYVYTHTHTYIYIYVYMYLYAHALTGMQGGLNPHPVARKARAGGHLQIWRPTVASKQLGHSGPFKERFRRKGP